MQEYDLSHGIDLRFSSPRLDLYLCDDGASYPPLESGLEEKFNPPLTTPTLITPSSPSTFRDNAMFNMNMLDLHLSLTQLTEFEVGETFSVNTSVDEDDISYESDNVFLEGHDFDATLV